MVGLRGISSASQRESGFSIVLAASIFVLPSEAKGCSIVAVPFQRGTQGTTASSEATKPASFSLQKPRALVSLQTGVNLLRNQARGIVFETLLVNWHVPKARYSLTRADAKAGFGLSGEGSSMISPVDSNGELTPACLGFPTDLQA